MSLVRDVGDDYKIGFSSVVTVEPQPKWTTSVEVRDPKAGWTSRSRRPKRGPPISIPSEIIGLAESARNTMFSSKAVYDRVTY